jgi:Na+-driven multidrug efflux pump
VSGAAPATAGAEGISGLISLILLMKRNLLKVRKMFQVPKWSSLKPLIQGGSTMLLFQMVLNVAFLTAARRVQAMDPTGVSAAAYGKCIRIFMNVFIYVCLVMCILWATVYVTLNNISLLHIVEFHFVRN